MLILKDALLSSLPKKSTDLIKDLTVISSATDEVLRNTLITDSIL